MDYKLTPITVMQWAEIQDKVGQKEYTLACVLACRYGLSEFNGEKVTGRNVEQVLSEMDRALIVEIGSEIIKESNLPKKK